MLIQLILLAAVLTIMFVFVRNSNVVYVQAGKRIALVLFALANVYAVMRPDDLTVVARLLGVGRGTDLVLYALVVAFMAGMFSMYQRFRVVDRRYTELARTVAIREAELVNPSRGLSSGRVTVATGDGDRTPAVVDGADSGTSGISGTSGNNGDRVPTVAEDALR